MGTGGDPAWRRALAGRGARDVRVARFRRPSGSALDDRPAGGPQRGRDDRMRRRERHLLPALLRRSRCLPRVEMSIGGGEWRLWREGEPFAQRFTGKFEDGGDKIAGRWERTDDGAY